jgi:glucokinase-like ROK family protein
MESTADHNLVRKLNSALVLDTLRRQAPISRAELAATTGLTRSTISSIVRSLLEDGLIRETTYQSDRIGRPGLLLELDPSGGFALGIELGVDFVSAIVTDFATNILWQTRCDSDPEDGQIAIMERTFSVAEKALEKSQLLGLRPLGIGIGVPGLVDFQRGELKLAPNLKWENIPVRLMWTQRFNLPVFVENEANAAALGEYYFGAARGVKTFIYISAGYGLGAGIMIDGKLFRGSHGYAAEIGHMTLDPHGEQCGCGKRGCYETVIGPRAVIRRVQQSLDQQGADEILETAGNDPEKISFEIVVNTAHKGNPLSLAVLEEISTNLGIMAANMINIFNPEMIVLGGVFSQATDFLLPVIKEVVGTNALGLSLQNMEVIGSQGGKDACVIGATALVLDSIWREPSIA